MSANEGKTVVSYMVAFTKADTPEKVEVFETASTLMDANGAKMQCWLNPDVLTCWTERLEQRRIGEILDRRKVMTR